MCLALIWIFVSGEKENRDKRNNDYE
jgi:hypothetical protein